MKFGSVCSGIEAASVAWEPLGWKAAWLSEIEPFPSAVLKHHYPDVPNLGDMTQLPDMILNGEVEAPDLFCGGTPCQAFSVAGLRKSLDDARGNLSLVFCEIANAIDHVRSAGGRPPAIVFWENVPGVLSTKDNAFGCFLAGLAGEDGELKPSGGKWTNAGCVYGPQRTVAWRVLDAQYFGVAQRRRRVFVVASARNDFDPASVLFEFDGLRRDTAPSREAGKEITISSGSGLVGGVDYENNAHGADEPTGPLLKGSPTGGGRPLPAIITMAHGQEVAQPMAFAQNSRDEVRLEGGDGSRTGALTSGGGKPGQGVPMVAQPVAFHPTQDPISSTGGNVFNCAGCGEEIDEAWGWGQWCDYCGHDHNENKPSDGRGLGGSQTSVALAVALRGREGGATAELGDEVQNCLRASQGGGDKPHVLAPVYTTKLHNTASNNAGKIFEERSTCLDANSPPPALLTAMQVRRLTPVECERLQGFPDNYTAIPWRNKPASECPDGPRYKALGNSWAVPVVRWIGQRIDKSVYC